ncbi:hypothetical protein [Falsiruegeria litorea]|nr:hypothetical protein [Falsiruegeria litorea]
MSPFPIFVLMDQDHGFSLTLIALNSGTCIDIDVIDKSARLCPSPPVAS